MRNNFKKERLTACSCIHLSGICQRKGRSCNATMFLLTGFDPDGSYSKHDNKQENEDRMFNYMQIHENYIRKHDFLQFLISFHLCSTEISP